MRKRGVRRALPEVEEIWFDAKVVLFLKRFVHIQPRSCEGGREGGREGGE